MLALAARDVLAITKKRHFLVIGDIQAQSPYPDYWEIPFLRAIFRVRTGDYSGASDTAERAAQLAPWKTRAWELLGKVHDGLGRASQAKIAKDRAQVVERVREQLAEEIALSQFSRGSAHADDWGKRAFLMCPAAGWEKITILHAEYHRPPDKALPGRYSRHYYDVAMMARGPIKEAAPADRELLARVVRHKRIFYPSAWARYDLAQLGTVRLLPENSRVTALRLENELNSH